MTNGDVESSPQYTVKQVLDSSFSVDSAEENGKLRVTNSVSDDSTTSSTRVSIINPDYSHETSVIPLISSAQDLTASWADIGPEIDKRTYTEVVLYGTLDINSSNDARIRVLGKFESAGSFEGNMMIETVSASDIKVEAEYIEFNVDADQTFILKINASAVPLLQVQVMAGTAGATAGQIDNLYYNMR